GHLDERVAARLGAVEHDGCGGPECRLARTAGAVGEIEGDIVAGHVEQAGPPDRLVLGQVAYSGHAGWSPSRFSPGRPPWRAPCPAPAGRPRWRTRSAESRMSASVPRSGPPHRGVKSRVRPSAGRIGKERHRFEELT